ncbi:MAG: hypothetical protein ACKVOT_04140 [Polaromonas sp.]
MPDRPATPRDNASARDATDWVEHRSKGMLVTAHHPFFKTAPTDLTDITIFNPPEFKRFRTSDALVFRVNP